MNFLQLFNQEGPSKTTEEGSSSASSPQSNSERMAFLKSQQAKNHSTAHMQSALTMIVNGELTRAKSTAHQIAEQGRSEDNQSCVELAGKIWTLANGLQETQQQIAATQYSNAQASASATADTARALLSSEHLNSGHLDQIIQAAGGYWTIAKDGSKALNADGAAKQASENETVDQYSMPHSRNWAYCGVATAIMLLRANGGSPPGRLQQDMTELAREIYITGEGSDVGRMAEAVRKRGLESAEATRTGTFEQLLDTLDSGQPVPFGVNSCTGEVVKLNSSGSTNFPGLRVGDQHSKNYPGSGHWVLVVGYEGSREQPTHFLYNDPAVGGQLRVSKDGLRRMGVDNGQFYLLTQ